MVGSGIDSEGAGMSVFGRVATTGVSTFGVVMGVVGCGGAFTNPEGAGFRIGKTFIVPDEAPPSSSFTGEIASSDMSNTWSE